MYKTLNKPGSSQHEAGRYVEVGPRGGKVKEAREINAKAGSKLPPTSEGGHLWQKIK